MMPSPNPLARSEGRDGCPCPPYVRCAHFGGQRVWLVENLRSLQVHPDFQGQVPAYAVFGPTKLFLPHDCCGYEHVHMAALTLESDSLAAAEAEFHRREALLLERANA